MARSETNRVELIWARLKALRPLWLLIFLGIAVHVLLPQFAQLGHLRAMMAAAAWWTVAAALAAQMASYSSSGYMLHALVSEFKQQFSVWRGILVTLAATSLGLLGGGWVTTGAATVQWVHESGVDAEPASLAGAIPLFLNNVALVVGASIGLAYLLAVRQLSTLQILAFAVVLAGMALIAAVAFWAAGNRERVTEIAANWNERLKTRFGISVSGKQLAGSLQDFFKSWDAMFEGKILEPILGAFGNVAFDALTLYFFFIALGEPVNFGVLLAGYGLPLLLAKVAFFFPGGVGVIETSMAGLFTGLGVPGDKAVVAVLAYRITSFWVRVLLGFPAIAWVRRLVNEP